MYSRRLFSELKGVNPILAKQLERICDEAADIWASQHLHEYTVHGGDHSAQVEDNLDSLAAHLQRTPNKLTPEEIFVLIAACHLHDIGMQLSVPDARAKHAEYAHDLILHSSAQIGPDQRRVTLSISNPNARIAIAKIARGHWTQFALGLPESDYIYENERGRLRLLALLLATADLLDTSPIRAGYFRSDHRLLDLPPLSELHQKMHDLVHGYQIRSELPEIPDKLIFELEWQDNSELVQQISEWLLRWFTSQIRQTAPALEKVSGGAIRWALPWAKILFRVPEGPVPQLSEDAIRVFKADFAAQKRIDRDQFVSDFKAALGKSASTFFVLPSSSDTDARYLMEWCIAYSRNVPKVRFAQIDVPAGAPLDRASLISQALEQWGKHLPACDNELAEQTLSKLVEDNKKSNFILFILTDLYDDGLLEPMLNVILKHGVGEGSRVVVIASPKGSVGPPLTIPTKLVDLSSFKSNDLDIYLEKIYGYGKVERGALIQKIENLDLFKRPGQVYTYIIDHCDSPYWHTHLEEAPTSATVGTT